MSEKDAEINSDLYHLELSDWTIAAKMQMVSKRVWNEMGQKPLRNSMKHLSKGLLIDKTNTININYQ